MKYADVIDSAVRPCVTVFVILSLYRLSVAAVNQQLYQDG